MKYLTIDRALKTYAGKEILDNGKVVTIKDILIQYVGQLFDSKDKKENLLAFHLGLRINDCTIGQLKLEDAEFDLVVKATDEPKGHGPMIMGPIYEELAIAVKNAEKLIEEAKVIKEDIARIQDESNG